MIISAIQFDIKWCDHKANQSYLEKYIENNLVDSDVVVLPEMFSTGFSMKPAKISQAMDGETVTWMRQIAVKYKKAIVGSVAIEEKNQDNESFFVNRLIFAKDNGEIEYMDKRHLFRMAGEDKVYSSGTERKIIEYKGVKFLPLVCYDLRFPIWSRCVDCQYDVILYVASWPNDRIDVWDTLLRARAIENQCYVVGVNRIGDDKSGYYSGHTVILDNKGVAMATAKNDTEESISAEVSAEKLFQAREEFPAFKDADKFTIGI